MAILNAKDAAHAPRPRVKPTGKPALFVRTLVPKGAIQRAISCSMLPSHALTASPTPSAQPPSQSARQLVVATDTSLQLLAVDDRTVSLLPLTDVVLFTRIFDVAVVSSPIPGRDVLVVLTEACNISFLQFDESLARLRCCGQVTVIPPPPFPAEASIRKQARLLATHPRKRVVAVASLQSIISVFPVLFLPEHVNAGKIALVHVEGVILSLDFLEDEEGVPGDAILVALLQKGKEQVIAIYTIGVRDVGGGLSVSFIGSMITCASHPDDIAVARATSKLTGESMRPTPPATAITRLPGCPFLFAVFVRGRIVAGDARSVIINAHSGEGLPMSVRIEHDIVLPSTTPQERVMDTTPDDDDRDSSHSSTMQPTTSESGVLTPTSSGVAFDSQDGFVTPTQTPTNRALGDPPPVIMPSRRARRGGRDDIPLMPSLLRRKSSSRSQQTGQDDLNFGEDYLSYLYVPAYISLDVGEENGSVTAWVDARDHFTDESGDGNALYFVMESGAMYALRWSENGREGTPTFRIPGGERARTSPKRNFSVEYISDVGPAKSIASLDRRLLYVANDCADGSLRRLHIPPKLSEEAFRIHPMGIPRGSLLRNEAARFGLEVRQEFLNLSPISDLAIVPPRRGPKEGKDSSHVHTRTVPRVGGLSKSTTAAGERKDIRLTTHRSTEQQQSAFDHVIFGGAEESEIVAGCGFGRHGTVRMIRPGAPVTILASSEAATTSCNKMWSLRFSRDSVHDAGIVMTFAQATATMLCVPPSSASAKPRDYDDRPAIAQLVDGTNAIGLLSDRRTLSVGIVDDGVLAQIHEEGVRLIFLKKGKDLDLKDRVSDGILQQTIYERLQDWSLPEGGIVSMGTVGFGFVVVSVISRDNQRPVLHLLQCISSEGRSRLRLVSSIELEYEVSCIEIPSWKTEDFHGTKSSNPQTPDVFMLGTYAPSIEVRSLDARLEVLDRRVTSPWSFTMSNARSEDAAKTSSVAVRESLDGQAIRIKGKQRKPRKRPIVRIRSRTKSDYMTAVPESVCARIVDGRKMMFVGLRDGSVMCMSLCDGRTPDSIDPSSSDSGQRGQMRLESHRKLAHCPVVIQSMTASIGPVLLAQAERPWMGPSTGFGRIDWIPLAFTETRSMCSLSVQGAERCFATIAKDNSLYICALRRKSPVSVRSFHVGATPRRVLAVSSPERCIVVATCNDVGSVSSTNSRGRSQYVSGSLGSTLMGGVAELRLIHRDRGRQLASVRLLVAETVHAMFEWLGFIVVGTAWEIHEMGPQQRCCRGRLLLYTFKHSTGSTASSSNALPRIKFAVSSEIVLPGAVLAGAAHPSADVFVASCNNDVIVFAVQKSRNALVEIARISVRMLVVSISVKDDIVSVGDRKDSISFFQLHSNSGKIERDRSDKKRRLVSDAVQADRTLAVAVDRLGALFSIGYDDGDVPKELSIVRPDGSVMSPYLRNMWDGGPSDQDAEGRRAEPSMMSVAGLGEEFDVMQQDSGSDHSKGSHGNSGSHTSACADCEQEASPETSEQEPIAGTDDSEADGNITGGNLESDGSNEVGADQGETDETNPAQSADDGMLVVVQDDENSCGDGDDAAVAEVVEAHLEERQSGVARNLVCHHSFNMNDTALRVRIGCFSREGKEGDGEYGAEEGCATTVPDDNFLPSANSAVLCGTLGGAIVTGVPMSAEAYGLLSEVEREVSDHMISVGLALGKSHKKYRSTFGREATCCVDGDLLKVYGQLDVSVRREIGAQVGCFGERGVIRIEGMINELWDRVG